MNEMRNAIESIDNRMDQAQESICEVQYRTLEIIQSSANKGKNKTSEGRLHEIWVPPRE